MEVSCHSLIFCRLELKNIYIVPWTAILSYIAGNREQLFLPVNVPDMSEYASPIFVTVWSNMTIEPSVQLFLPSKRKMPPYLKDNKNYPR